MAREARDSQPRASRDNSSGDRRDLHRGAVALHPIVGYDGHRADLFRFSQGMFEHYGQALANSVLATARELSQQEREKLLEAASTTSVIRITTASNPPAG